MAQNYEVLLVAESSGQQCNVNAYDLKNGQSITTFKGSTSEANTLSVCRNEHLISSIPKKAVIQVYDLCRKSQQSAKIVLPGVVKALCVSHDNSILAAGVGEKVLVWELSGGELLAILSRHYQNVTCLSFSDDGSYLVSSGEDGIVSVWDVADVWDSMSNTNMQIEAYHSWTSHTLPVTGMKFGSRFRVYSASLDHALKIHDVPTKQTIMTIVLNSPINCIALGPNEACIYAGCSDGRIDRINLLSCGHELRSGSSIQTNSSKENDKQSIVAHEKAVSCLCVSLDGTYLISGSVDAKVKVWDTASHQCLRTIKCSGGITNAILNLSSPFFHSSTSKPSAAFPKLSHQVLSPGEKPGNKYFKICKTETENAENAQKLIEELSLPRTTAKLTSDDFQDLLQERNRLLAENKKLYQYALNNILK